MKKLKNLTLSIKVNRLIGWGSLIIGGYGFVLFMLPVVYRLTLSIGLLALGATCLSLPTVVTRLLKRQPKTTNTSTQ